MTAKQSQLDEALRTDGATISGHSPFLETVRDERAAAFRLLWEQRTLVFRWTCYGLLFGLAMAFLIPKSYDSTTRLMPPDSQSSSGIAMLAALAGKGNSSLGTLAGDLLGTKSSGALFTDMLHSRTVQDRIVDRFNLRHVYGVRYQEAARKELGRRTDVMEEHKSGVITVTVSDHDSKRAQQIAQAYVEELDRLVAQVSTSAARRQRVFIEQRLTGEKQELADSEQRFSVFASKNATLDVKEQTKAMVESAALLQGQMIAAQSELQGLEQIYAGNNIRVRALKARISELQHQLDKLGGSTAELPPQDKTSTDFYPSLRQLPLLGVEWADLYRNVKVQETVFELLTQQYEIARIEEAKEIPTVKMLDTADLPEKKSFPPRTLITLAGGILGLMTAGFWLIGGARWRDLSPGDPNKVLISEVLYDSRSYLRMKYLKLKNYIESGRSKKRDPQSDV